MASGTIKAMRLILYTMGFVSMFLVMFMAQRLEKRFQSLEAKLMEVTSFTTSKDNAGSKGYDQTSIIWEKVRRFREYTSNAEAILESMEATQHEEEELAMSGVSLTSKKGFLIFGGLSLGNITETFAARAARSADKAQQERTKQENIKRGDELKKLEATVAERERHEAHAEHTNNVGGTNGGVSDADHLEAMIVRMENEAATHRRSGDMKPHLFAKDHPMSKFNKDGSPVKDNVLVVIISNRRDGIIPTVASILTTSSRPVDIVLIGEHDINHDVHRHFGDRINDFTSMSVKDVEDDLVAQNYKPIWTWPEWHTSMQPSWKNNNTLHVGPWDNLMTHAHVLNHIRFYLPLCSIFRGRPYFYFLDDDILVQHDLGVLAERTMQDLPSERGLVCACNIWMWNSKCFHFEFQAKKDYILSMPSLYGDRGVCQTESESHCVPENYWDWVKSVLPKGGESQHAWNFGFSLFGIDNWIANGLTEKYERVMKASYEKHVFPETSLTFGLGVAYIAFAGAVECWNENYVQVRDGFGFIEWDRYAKTFGDDFFKDVHVVHYTGPDKPWVDYSRIEQRAIVPWLKMMSQEGMPIPKQLPHEPTDNLFTLLAGDRSGAQWIMSMLDKHPEVCASGEEDKPETGFSADVLMPSGLPWYPYCSIKRGCSLEFYKTNVQKLLTNVTSQGVPMRCLDKYNSKNDDLEGHLQRMCNVVSRLKGNYTDGAIAQVWVDGFMAEDRSVTGCGCVRGVKAKGLKVLSEWITYRGYPGEKLGEPEIDLNQTKVVGSKIIRLKRNNTWARYKSMMMAIATERYHPLTIGEKLDQLGMLNNLEIDVHHMEWNIRNFQQIDRAGDEWAIQHSKEILWVDYETCRLHTRDCFKEIYEFIGVDPSHVDGSYRAKYESTFSEMQDKDATLELVANSAEIKEVLGANGWGHMIGGETYTPIQLMVYHTDNMFLRTFNPTGINITYFGSSSNSMAIGNRFLEAKAIMLTLDPDALIVLCADRDCWTNFPVSDKTYKSLSYFRQNFEKITASSPGAIVASTEVECCASALTHIRPGDLFDKQGRRSKRACLSGEDNCLWNSDSNAEQWMRFMVDVASKSGASNAGKKRPFLDGSVLVGKVKDFIKLVDSIDIDKDEDDRAVLTDFFYRNPSRLVLDYDQVLIGQAREFDVERNIRCPTWHINQNSKALEDSRRYDFLSEVEPEKRPLFLFSPRYHGCDHVRKTIPDTLPSWGPGGIPFQPILDHINRVIEEDESIVLLPVYGRVPDYRQGPEMPYFVDNNGLWTSELIRSRTDESTLRWRMTPTEQNKLYALKLLVDEAKVNPDNVRWKSLIENLKGGVGFFYWAWYGDYKACNYKNREEDSIPLFTTCASRFCDHSFPIPNYMNIIDTQASSQNWRGVFLEFQTRFPWESKIDKIVWRGALSEAEWRDALTSVRWRVNKLVTEYNLKGSKIYDVGLTGIPRWLTTRVKFNISEVGGFLPGISPMSTFMNYKAILDMDGNSWSSRFGTLLCYNSVVVKVEPKYFEYFYPELKPWTHFIPVKNDLSDFHKNIQWALNPANSKAVQSIIESANDWCSRRLLPHELARDQLDIWESYIRQLNQADKDWTTKLKVAKRLLSKRRYFNLTNVAPDYVLEQL